MCHPKQHPTQIHLPRFCHPTPATYHNWKKTSELGFAQLKDDKIFEKKEKEAILQSTNPIDHNSDYMDVPGFCKAATIEEVKALNFVVTPGRYVGLPDDEDDFNFAERFSNLKTELEKQIAEEDELNKRIAKNLSKINVTADVEGL